MMASVCAFCFRSVSTPDGMGGSRGPLELPLPSRDSNEEGERPRAILIYVIASRAVGRTCKQTAPFSILRTVDVDVRITVPTSGPGGSLSARPAEPDSMN